MKPFKNPELYINESRIGKLCRLNYFITALNLTIILANIFIIHVKGICQ